MLTPTQYASADAFLQLAQSALLQNEVANHLMLGVSLGLRNYPERIKAAPFLFTIENDLRQIELAAVMTPPHNLILQCFTPDNQAALELLADHLLSNEWSIPGVIGALPGCAQFADLWERRTGCRARVNMQERAFELREVIAPQKTPGRLRPAELVDLPLLVDWTRAFMFDAVHEEMSMEQAKEFVAMKIGARHLFVWDIQAPVSMAAATRPTLHGVAINLVYTPPHLRGRGYASNCVAALSQHMLDQGYQFCALFTDLANPTSNDIYQQIGYHPIADFNEYHFEND